MGSQNPTALALCVHHKPWLAMSSLITAFVQDEQSFDIHFLHNLGDGTAERTCYQRFHELAKTGEGNWHLSAYEPAVRSVCELKSSRVATVEYENDHGLDSGAFYKFIRDGRWRPYEHTLFAGEGTLFACPNTLSTLLTFAGQKRADFIESGHEQRRLPKKLMLEYCSRHTAPSAMDRFHDEMIRETFEVFCRDPDFRAVFDRWSSEFDAATEHHVPKIPPRTPLGQRVRRGLVRRLGAPHEDRVSTSRLTKLLRELPYRLDYLGSRISIGLGRERSWDPPDSPVGSNADRVVVNGIEFRRVQGPEWFGCTPTVLLSRSFLERMVARLERFRMYDVLDLPFAATGLEVVWGFLPAWLGADKWFTSGFHRVRKDFVTYRREDHAPDLASYINRYHRGRVCVAWEDDLLKVRALKSQLSWVRNVLPAVYF